MRSSARPGPRTRTSPWSSSGSGTPSSSSARGGAAIPRAFEATVAALGEEDPPDPRVALARLAGGPPSEPDHVELGAANAWRSVGPLRLWTQGEPPAPLGLAARLAAHPALARCTRPVALEVAFRRPRECWLGVEVSTRVGGVHVVDPAGVEALVARLLRPFPA